ncbi:Thioredoxin-2 [Gryllus bimaculatus]|nr:Thioredoxin-2 [Gryllus bimaculatus]
MKLYRIKSQPEFEKVIMKYKGDLLVIFFRALWCTMCKVIMPRVEEAGDSIPKNLLFEVDVDEIAPIARRYKIKSVPCFLFLLNRMEVDRVAIRDISVFLPYKEIVTEMLTKVEKWTGPKIVAPEYLEPVDELLEIPSTPEDEEEEEEEEIVLEEEPPKQKRKSKAPKKGGKKKGK